jgi:hypothetical protein
MLIPRRFAGPDLALLLVVFVGAAGVRFWYLSTCADHARSPGPLSVQDESPALTGLPAGTEMHGRTEPTEQDALASNLNEHKWFGSLAPLAATEELIAPSVGSSASWEP